MQLKTLSILTLMVILSGCVKTNYNHCLRGKDLPELPIAGEKVANELETVCRNQNCSNINNWLNELYFFKKEYVIIKQHEK